MTVSEVTPRGPRRLDDARTELINRVSESVSPDLQPAVERYFDLVAPEDLVGRNVRDVSGMIQAHAQLARNRMIGSARVSAVAPSIETDEWQSSHTVVQVVTDDMPFLVDSVTTALTQQGRAIHLVMHPRFIVRRNGAGELVEIIDAADSERTSDAGTITESWICVEIDRETDANELRDIEKTLQAVLQDVRNSVTDWTSMRDQISEVTRYLQSTPELNDDACIEAITFLEWLNDDHFTFVGFSEYEVDRGKSAAVSPKQGTGLGVLRGELKDLATNHLASAVAEFERTGSLLLITKADVRSTVHRSAYLDHVGIMRVEGGKVIGEYRFVGLFTATAYTEPVSTIPVISRKVDDVTRSMALDHKSHSGKDLLQLLETYPRDELFQMSAGDLESVARGVLGLQERRQVRVFTRTEVLGRYVSALVYFPRDRYTTEVRERMEHILISTYGAASIDHLARVSESVLSRLYFVVRMPVGQTVPTIDADLLELRLAEATRFWEDDFAESVIDQVGEEDGVRMIRTWTDAFPESFKEDVPAVGAVSHLQHLESLQNCADGEIAVSMYRPALAEDGTRRFTIYRLGDAITLSSILPMLHDMGVEVTDERAYDLRRPGREVAWIYDFGLSFDDTRVPDADTLAERFCEAFISAWHGDVDSDGFNALVLFGGLSARNVGVIRAYAAYLRQAGTPFSQGYLQQVLLANVGIVQLLLQLFATRFDPDFESDRSAAGNAIMSKIETGLDAVASLDHDRIMRSSVALVNATLRTNVYQIDAHGNYGAVMAFKMDPSQVPDLPLPLPKFEIWVFSPRVEGVHLRFASIARGGLRWSDRLEDFRTEILGLVKAQMVKNSVIVPSGAKGGFVMKRGPEPTNRDAWLAEGIACYQAFIGALLDVTDNLVAGSVVPPERVVRHDSDDPYLVVAADKGTATFSDIANQIALDRGFWLGDAFASGGSIGYDHKVMGITARGAWESVKRHFLEIGVNTQTQDFTVVGVGDMSGDVFGNGMLLSEHIRLIAAFDHRHIFLDPNPDSAKSFVERQRLFNLPRSSWEDYSTKLISKGGGIFPRAAKSIDLTPEVKESLGIATDVDSLPPAELLSYILKAPVDLLWNGGIGTYVKSSSETHAQVGDKANDSLRINGNELRVRVVGEGGNLGFTQLGRIEAAHSGVSINTDAIDNSAGVDTSDHEVNIKILLDQAIAQGKLAPESRHDLLTSMTDEVGQLVLRDNYEQNLVLEQTRFHASSMLRVHQRVMLNLETKGLLNRTVEYLPTDSAIDHLHAQGQGLTSPELAVLMAYVKIDLSADGGDGGLVNESWCKPIMTNYFPSALHAGYGEVMDSHPLRSDIISTVLVNEMVNRGGISFVARAVEESGAGSSEIMRAYVVSRDVFNFNALWNRIEELDGTVSTDCQTELYLESRRLLDRATRWFLQSRGGRLDVLAEIEKFAPSVSRIADRVPSLLRGAEQVRFERHVAEYVKTGAPEDVARTVAALLDRFSLLDVIEVGSRVNEEPDHVVELYFALSERYDVDRLLAHISALPRDDRWSANARSALRSDLYAALAGLTLRVAKATAATAAVDSRISEWEATFAEGVARTRLTLNEIALSEQADLATLSVALRAIRTLVGQGAS